MTYNELREINDIQDQKNEINNLIDQKKEAIKQETDQNKKSILKEEIKELEKAQTLLEKMSKIITNEKITEKTKTTFILALKNGLNYIKTKYKITLPDDIDRVITSNASTSSVQKSEYSEHTQNKLNPQSVEYDKYYKVRQADGSVPHVAKKMDQHQQEQFSRAVGGAMHFDQNPLTPQFRQGRDALLRLGITKEGKRGLDNTLDLFSEGKYLANKMKPLLNYLITYGLNPASASYTDKNTNIQHELKVQQALKTLRDYLEKDVKEIKEISEKKIRETQQQLQTAEKELQKTKQDITNAQTEKAKLDRNQKAKNERLYNQIIALNQTKGALERQIKSLENKLTSQKTDHQLLLDQIQLFENDLNTAEKLLQIGDREKRTSLQQNTGPQALDDAFTIGTQIDQLLNQTDN